MVPTVQKGLFSVLGLHAAKAGSTLRRGALLPGKGRLLQQKCHPK